MPFINNKSIIQDNSWKIINTNDLPEGIQSIALPSVELFELLTNTDNGSHVIVPLNDKIQQSGLTAETINLIAKDNKIGVWIDSHATTQQLDQLLQQNSDEQADEIALILIDVADFNNGRAFSLSQYLRLQGYHGEIRLTGKFGIDQLAYYQRAGIDSFGISDEQNEQQQADVTTAFNALATAPTGRTANELPIFKDI